jgi:hypothetical protein
MAKGRSRPELFCPAAKKALKPGAFSLLYSLLPKPQIPWQRLIKSNRTAHKLQERIILHCGLRWKDKALLSDFHF